MGKSKHQLRKERDERIQEKERDDMRRRLLRLKNLEEEEEQRVQLIKTPFSSLFSKIIDPNKVTFNFDSCIQKECRDNRDDLVERAGKLLVLLHEKEANGKMSFDDRKDYYDRWVLVFEDLCCAVNKKSSRSPEKRGFDQFVKSKQKKEKKGINADKQAFLLLEFDGFNDEERQLGSKSIEVYRHHGKYKHPKEVDEKTKELVPIKYDFTKMDKLHDEHILDNVRTLCSVFGCLWPAYNLDGLK